jgi:hypothetical protein
MFLIDSLLVGGLRFVLDTVARAVDQERDEVRLLQDELVAAQLAAELGEISDAEFLAREQVIIAALREARTRQQPDTAADDAIGDRRIRVADVEIRVDGHDGA